MIGPRCSPKVWSGLLGLPHVDHAEPVLRLARRVEDDSFHRPVRQRLHAVLAAGELAGDLVVLLLGQARTLMHQYNRHGGLPLVDRPTLTGARSGALVLDLEPPPSRSRARRAPVARSGSRRNRPTRTARTLSNRRSPRSRSSRCIDQELGGPGVDVGARCGVPRRRSSSGSGRSRSGGRCPGARRSSSRPRRGRSRSRAPGRPAGRRAGPRSPVAARSRALEGPHAALRRPDLDHEVLALFVEGDGRYLAQVEPERV